MPNWCSTSLAFFPAATSNENQAKDNAAALKKLYTAIKKHTEKEYIHSDFGTSWLGNIAIGFGLYDKTIPLTAEPRTVSKTINVPCRGSIDVLDFVEDILYIDTTTAWEPMIELWQKIIDEVFPGCIDFVFQAEEPGNGLFVNTDISNIHFSDRYILMMDNIEETHFCYSEQRFPSEVSLLRCVNGVFGHTFKSISDFQTWLSANGYSESQVYIESFSAN